MSTLFDYTQFTFEIFILPDVTNICCQLLYESRALFRYLVYFKEIQNPFESHKITEEHLEKKFRFMNEALEADKKKETIKNVSCIIPIFEDPKKVGTLSVFRDYLRRCFLKSTVSSVSSEGTEGTEGCADDLQLTLDTEWLDSYCSTFIPEEHRSFVFGKSKKQKKLFYKTYLRYNHSFDTKKGVVHGPSNLFDFEAPDRAREIFFHKDLYLNDFKRLWLDVALREPQAQHLERINKPLTNGECRKLLDYTTEEWFTLGDAECKQSLVAFIVQIITYCLDRCKQLKRTV